MLTGALQGLVSGTEYIVFDHEVSGAAVSSISTGNILNGDEDGWYTIIIRYIAGANGSFIYTRFNNDSGNNYGTLGILANNTTVNGAAATAQSGALGGYCATSGRTSFLVGRMYAKSGAVRLINYSWCFDITGTTCTEIRTLSYVWNNTADNITNINFVGSGTDIGVGTRIIILKSNNFTNGTPTGIINTPYIQGSWVRVGSQVLGSAASSVTFSGLDGDTAICYYLSASVKASGGNINFAVLPNNDSTATNFGYQDLRAANTSVGAARGTYGGLLCNYNSIDTGTYAQISLAMFAKKGFLRPAICSSATRISTTTINEITSHGLSWSNTADNITSLVISTTNAYSFDAGSQFDLYALYK